MFAGLERTRVKTQEATINAVYGGEGPPVLLLHGYPQTHAMWHRVAPLLAGRFTVVATDLRGYGDSSKPTGGEDHAAYSKRAMAGDQVEVMETLGFDRFAVVGHDAARFVVPLVAQELLQHGAASILAFPPRDTVGDGEHGCPHGRLWR